MYIQTFVGTDADLVHWEQSYNCGGEEHHRHIFETFVRQAMMLPSKAVVVFTDSNTFNW
jgi:hypothetical protein